VDVTERRLLPIVGTETIPARRPVLLAVDDETEAIGRVGDELQRRYGDDYEVVAEQAAIDALTKLEAMRARRRACFS
jgi:hypothetical protein